ncbi:hypothetical protein AQJ30_15550 [Streptomyces longwoodensis]|uniref:Uncharacterized protein n=1 Tax=Streptomyces longwoodensis TaxID=68231 RepID=A0A101QXF4_9ACTN|nr:hypothetical protein [Streptomyces longwoodensis]KUN37698.1 hypothetical protein AQJ30_15550 [Streptomyces longwoodensis]
MTTDLPDVHLVIYGAGRFPPPFGLLGYLFTVPGSYPDDLPAHLHGPNQELAVYLKPDEPDTWEARATEGERRVYATGPSRRETIGLAFLEIARRRRREAAQVAAKRAAAGLEPAPPYAVEVTSATTLVLTGRGAAVLHQVVPADDDTPARYHCHDIEGSGATFVITADQPVTLQTISTGVLHARCAHGLEDADACFENEPDALAYITDTLTAFWPCTDLPAN